MNQDEQNNVLSLEDEKDKHLWFDVGIHTFLERYVDFNHPLQRRDYDFQDLDFSIIITPNEIDPDIEKKDPTTNASEFKATISFMDKSLEDIKIPDGIELIDVTENNPRIECVLKSFFIIKLSRDYDILHNNIRILSLNKELGRWRVSNYKKTESRKLFEKKRKYRNSAEHVNKNQSKLTDFFQLRNDDDEDKGMIF
ncbi:30042_t:CDS:2 [Gigaspora margarita]|uniref:30042_t:CDS:1 n=1 Tax=Gigaspora margarita TaxID=4874 RepID=A0ABN7UYF1_GIGMA|nr:30042_t:CDS:2 [Gigaspora margarita]